MNIFKHISRNNIENLVIEAIKEDKAFSDITTQMCVPEDREGSAFIIAKENGIIAGIQLAEVVMQVFGTYVVKYEVEDGHSVSAGDTMLHIKGKMRGILSAERIILNFMQRMSGIATASYMYIKLVEGKNIKILDTRKTTPSMRLLEKYSVKCGGGTNHRMDLFDEIMIKDNHLDIIKNNLEVIKRMKNKYPEKPITVEVADPKNIEHILNYPVDRIMLDNMTPAEIKKSVKIINRRCEIEVSGNISAENILQYLIDGVNFISIGKLTHSYKSLDLSMKIEDNEN